ncbi:uncharacterized protein [Nicotiana sylvestris]|uniref:uncharacterized protein n=1 Tax=Nicotiana sylvestris TaxID=4096 RepID=UPI00388CDC0E
MGCHDGLYVPTKVLEELPFSMPKTRKEYTDVDMKVVEKNFLAKKILVCGIGPDENNRISACETAKEIWEALQTAHEGTTQTCEMKRKIDSERREPKIEKNMVLKADSNDSSKEDSDMTYLNKRFQKMVRRNGGMLKRGISSKPKNYDLCHKCGKPGHFIKYCPLLKQELSKYYLEKGAKRNPVPDNDFKRKRSANNMVKQALAAWGDSSSKSEDETYTSDSSMMVVESEENEYDSTFALMDQSDNDKDDDNSEVYFRDVQRNLKSYSPKKLMSLANILIDAYHSLVEDKDALTLELGEAEQTRDDLVVCVVDLKETICDLKKETNVLTKKVDNLEHERYDLVVIVVDHKETIENFNEEKEALVKRVTEIKEERDDLLVVVADLTIEGLGTESKPENTGKGKEVASEEHIRRENELKAVRTRLCVETEINKHIQTELERICDKGNKVKFLSKICTVTNLVTGEVKDLVHGLPMSKFKVQKVRDSCAREKHVKSSFKSKNDVSTSKTLDLLHMDLCGPMRVQIRGGKRYISVIVDDYFRFTWTLFLRTKDETFKVFVAFVKKLQVKMEFRVACIRSDHGTKFDNAKFNEFCNENGITHNFLAPRTPPAK